MISSKLYRTVALAAIACAALASQSANAQSVSVMINGQPFAMSPGPIEQAGRVFVPLRGIFERFGAGVVYSAGTINATKGSTTVSLRIGSVQATVNGQPQQLDVAPFIVGSTTYVPLRFIAQSLGARVGYDNGTRVVSIDIAHPVEPIRPIRPNPPPPNPPPANVNLRAQQPAPGATIVNRFAVISAQFSRSVEPGSVRVLLDGGDVTSQSGVSPTGFSYKPPAPLDFGAHTVRVTGRIVPGARFDRSWSFTVRRSGQPGIQITIDQPAPNAPVARTFLLSGNTAPNASVEVTAGATPSTTGQFSGNTTAGGAGHFKITVRLSTMPGQSSVRVRITATDPANSQSAQTTLQLRLSQ